MLPRAPHLAASDRLRILVLGYLVRGPVAGFAWHHVQYVLGLAALGHDVYFLEDSDDYPSCYDPVRLVTDTDPAYGLGFADRALRRLGLGERWAYHDAHAGRWHGPCAGRALDLCATADLLLNVSGVNPLRPWLARVPARAFIDTDPAFTQLRTLTDAWWRERALGHTTFFSFGENIPAGRSAVPADGLRWQATRQPIFLDAWPVTPGPARGAFTTVMQWDSYPGIEHGGVRYGMKSESFGPYFDFPRRAGGDFEMAVGGGPGDAPQSVLRRGGWRLCDSRRPSRTPWTYQRYIQGSRAEFSVAKQGYVVSRGGWFSERSACYLASGRPVVVQDTGFTDWLPAGAGVLPFADPDGALAAVEAVNARYEFHCREARAVAEAHFDARRVLSRLLEQALAPLPQ
jgi:hypothetical protein